MEKSQRIGKKIASILMNDRVKCNQCKLEFCTKYSLDRHLMNKHKPDSKQNTQAEVDKAISKWFKCRLCSDRFVLHKSLEKHMKFHNKMVYKCDHCDEKFKNRLERKAHMTKIHEIKLFNCDFCASSFILKNRLLHHLLLHESDQEAGIVRDDFEHMSKSSFKRKCPTCGRIFTHRTHFKNHLLWHKDPNLFACSICQKQFTRRVSLNRHMLIHNNQKEFPCKFCEKEFTRFDALNVHLRNHTGESPYKCEECSREFTTATLLSGHSCSEAPERRLTPKNQCKVCLKYFAPTHVKQHMNIHSGKKPFSCKHCPMTYGGRQSLYRHLKMKHPK